MLSIFDENEDAVCAVAFIGYVEGPMGDGYRGFFEERGYLEEYAFMAEIPYDNYVETNGSEFYCIIPKDPNASIAINEWIVPDGDVYEGYSGEVLYRSESGEPITVLCNEAGSPNVQVNIVEEDGDVVSFWPMLDVMDSSLVVEQENRGKVLDITIYGGGYEGTDTLAVTAEELVGDWRTVVPTEDDERMICHLYFNNEEGSQSMAYWYGPEYSEVFEAFEGFYYNANGMGNATNPEQMMFDMMLVGGIALESIEPYSFGGVYEMRWADESKETLVIIHVEGAPLLYGYEYATMEFTRYYE